VKIYDVSATARCTADAAGLHGLDGAVPDLGSLALDITVVSPEPEERLQKLFAVWKQRCPIYLALQKPNAVAATFTCG
jgi:hypothetical protein